MHAVLLVLALSIGAGLGLFLMFGVWHVWMFVIPAIFPNAPDSVAHPGFWVFLAAWILLGFFGRALFGSRS